MRQNSSFNVRYDDRADVLYIVYSDGISVRGVEDGAGIFWRLDDKGAALSATIMDAFDRWHDDQRTLANRLGDRFRISPKQAKGVVETVFNKINREHHISP